MVNHTRKNEWIGSYRAWLIWLIGALFYCYQFVLRVSPNIMTDELMYSFSIDATALSIVVASYYYAYSALQIPLGVTMDLFGPRKILTAAGFICAIACFTMANATSPAWASVARFMIGFGSACVFLGTCKLATLWLHPKQLGIVIGLTFALGTTGAAIGGFPLELLVSEIGWRNSLKILGIIGAAIGFLILIIAKDTPPNRATKVAEKEDEPHILAGLLQVVLTPQAWLIAFYGMLMFVPLIIVGDLWGVSFIEKVYDVEEKIAAPVVTAMFVGIAMGSPMFAMFSDRFDTRRTPMIISAAVTMALYLIIILVHGIPMPMMYVLFFLVGFFFTGQCLCFASVCEIMPIAASGVAVGFTNMIIMLFGVIWHPLVGLLLDFSWEGEKVDDVPFYTADDFRFAFLIIPACLGLALLLTQVIRETHPGRYPK